MGAIRTPVASIALVGFVACRAAPTEVRAQVTDAALDAGGARPFVPAVEISPPYDLDAEIRARVDRCRAELGVRAVSRVVGDVFLLAAPAPSPKFDEGVKLVESAIPALYHDRFARPVDRAVTVFVLPSAAAYRAFCVAHYGAPCAGRYGVYGHGTREAVVDLEPGIATLTHEIVHPMVERDFPAAPTWFDEGLGALFENPVLPRPGEIKGASNWRRGELARALRSPASRAKVRLDALFALSDAAFHGADESLHYAMARYLCQWLDSQHELWPFYRAWRDGVATDPTGERAFASVMNQTPAEANRTWLDWFLALREP